MGRVAEKVRTRDHWQGRPRPPQERLVKDNRDIGGFSAGKCTFKLLGKTCGCGRRGFWKVSLGVLAEAAEHSGAGTSLLQ